MGRQPIAILLLAFAVHGAATYSAHADSLVHGVKDPKLATLTAKHADVAARLRLFVAEEDIEMIVMGAFVHSRFREAVLGGVTRSMLDDRACPFVPGALMGREQIARSSRVNLARTVYPERVRTGLWNCQYSATAFAGGVSISFPV